MITFKADIVSSNKRKDGTYMVVIRVTFKGKSRRLPTTLVCRPSDLTRSGKIKSADILTKADTLIGQMREAVRDLSPFVLESRDVDWVVSHIRGVLSGQNFRLDFFEWADRLIAEKHPTTREAYKSCINVFERFIGKRELDINDIRKGMLLDFADWVEDNRGKNAKGMPGKTSAQHLVRLRHIYNEARRRYNDDDSDTPCIPRMPFSSLNIAATPVSGQPNIGRELMQRMISAETDRRNIRFALDVFIVSFALMGANFADLYAAESFPGKWWIYNRAKTSGRRTDRAEMRVLVPDELAPFIARLRGTGPMWLNSLQRATKKTVNRQINEALERWCESEGVAPFTLYAARHTFASLARTECGIDKSTIDDCLCHKGDFQLADIYAERAWGLMQEANRAVINLFEWPKD